MPTTKKPTKQKTRKNKPNPSSKNIIPGNGMAAKAETAIRKRHELLKSI